jgi:hypothetical protein
MSRLIETYGGKPIHAPAMREAPRSSNLEALKFADALFQGKLHAVVFLTGVGARALSNVLEGVHPKVNFFEALRKVSVIARGPKPLAVLREWNVPVALAAPEPNTWRELLQAIDDNKLGLRDKTISPKRGGITLSQTLKFSAAVLNDPSNHGVTWTASSGTLTNVTPTSATYNPADSGSIRCQRHQCSRCQ